MAARQRLLPVLPVEVVRLRVRRAKELGLEYRTYASVRAATGHDVVAFLFSSNALRVSVLRPMMPEEWTGKLAAVTGCDRVALVVVPLTPEEVEMANPVMDRASAAPFALAGFGEARAALRAALGRVPADQVLLVGDMALERDWCAAGRLGAYLPAERYFG